jgi:hypothetical protein
MPPEKDPASRTNTLTPWLTVAAALVIPGGMIIGGAYLARRLLAARKQRRDEAPHKDDQP